MKRLLFLLFGEHLDPLLASEADANSRRRYRSIWNAAGSGVLSKGTGMVVAVACIPLATRYLGIERYGLWITLTSAVNMFLWLDIGIASALTNLISEAFAKDDRALAAEYFASAFWMILMVSGLIGAAAWALWPHLDWAFLLHLQNASLVRDASFATAAALGILLVSLPAALAQKLLSGYQEVHIANLFTAAGNLLSFVAVLLVVYCHGTFDELVVGYAGAPVAANLACLFWTVLFHKPWLKPWPQFVRLPLVRRVFHTGSRFFIIQVASVLAFNSDSLVISHYLGPAAVTPYSITFRLTAFVTAFQSLVVPALWPAYSEAFHRGDLAWIRSTYSMVRSSTAGLLTVGCAVLLFSGKPILHLLAGPNVTADPWLLRLMCIWMVILSITINQTCLMAAASRISNQAISTAIAAVVNVGLSIFLIKHLGVVGVILGTIITFLLFNIIVQTWEVHGILRGRFAPDAFKVDIVDSRS